MWREEPALTDEQIVDFLRQQGWTWLVPGSHAVCANKIPLGLSTWMNRILKTGTAVGRGTAGVRLGTESFKTTESVSKILHQHLLLTEEKKRVEKLPLEANNLVIQSVHAILWLLIFGWYNKMNPETVRHHGI
eukprot:g74766.t1